MRITSIVLGAMYWNPGRLGASPPVPSFGAPVGALLGPGSVEHHDTPTCVRIFICVQAAAEKLLGLSQALGLKIDLYCRIADPASEDGSRILQAA